MSTLLAMHFDAIKVIVLSAAIIWVITVASVLFGLSRIKKVNERDASETPS